MIVDKIRLIGLYTIDLPIAVAHPSDSYILKGADGLGPSDVTVTMSDSTVQGGTYQGRRPANKQPVFLIGLNPNFKMGETAGRLREKLYGLLNPQGTDLVTIQLLKNDVVVAQINGYVSKLEQNAFVNEPEVQVTIDCNWPYFQAPEPVIIIPETKDSFDIWNIGNARTGMMIEVSFTEDRSNWRLYGSNDEVMHFQYDFKFGDVLQINTEPGSRFVRRIRGEGDGSSQNIIYALEPESTWLMLRGGKNTFTTGSQSFNWGSITFAVQYEGL